MYKYEQPAKLFYFSEISWHFYDIEQLHLNTANAKREIWDIDFYRLIGVSFLHHHPWIMELSMVSMNFVFPLSFLLYYCISFSLFYFLLSSFLSLIKWNFRNWNFSINFLVFNIINNFLSISNNAIIEYIFYQTSTRR